MPHFSLLFTLKIQALFLFETLVPTYETIRYDIMLIISTVMAFMFGRVRKIAKSEY